MNAGTLYWKRLLPLALVLIVAWTVAATEFEIPRYTMQSGGGASTGGGFTVVGTIGQVEAGQLAGGGFAVTGGFWIPCVPGDRDCDGDVDIDDHAAWPDCLAGPDQTVGTNCRVLDFDGDDDVDLQDWSAFQQAFTG